MLSTTKMHTWMVSGHAMMPNEEWGLVGKVAIVTGGGAMVDGIGNGRAAAVLLARAGPNVLVVDRDLAFAERTAAMIAADGGNAVAARADIQDRDGGILVLHHVRPVPIPVEVVR